MYVSGIKLAYTDEMKQQDSLWLVNRESLPTMKRLQKQIILNAIEFGFEGFAKVSVVNIGRKKEVQTEIAYNFAEHQQTGVSEGSYGHCKTIIKMFENQMNNNIGDEH